MKTLTEMLRDSLKMEPECDAEAKAVEDELTLIKTIFKNWLKGVGLPDYDTPDKQGVPFSATDSLRQLLVTLVDEP